VLLTTVAHRLFSVEVPLGEKIIRTLLVYGVLLLLLRLGGKRTAAQLNTFDLVVLLLLSNVVQNAIIGSDNSLLGGVIGAAVLVGVNDLVSRFARRNGGLDRVLEGTETKLVEDGSYVDRELRSLGIRPNDLEVALRRQGAEHVSEVKKALLYPSGAIVVELRPEARGASEGDIDRLERKLDRLTEAVARLSRSGS
jgi:uncharacterized membrane protein YcaP (DUF421 family)